MLTYIEYVMPKYEFQMNIKKFINFQNETMWYRKKSNYLSMFRNKNIAFLKHLILLSYPYRL